MKDNNRLKIFTWHTHGSYLHYLSHANVEIFVPVNKYQSLNYVGLPNGSFPWKENLHEIPVDQVEDYDFDVILFQNKQQYLEEQFKILSGKQRQLPKIFVEHDPPREHPVDTKHVVDDPKMLLIHVTHFNSLMWDSNQTPTTVIEHGVVMSNVSYTGELTKGVVLVNNMQSDARGKRRMGFDLFNYVKQFIPLDVIGMGSREIGGLGEVSHKDLSQVLSKYRFFFNPIRYTSMPLSVIEGMMVGLPIIGMATTELPTVITNGYDGYVHTDIDYLILQMKKLLQNKEKAMLIGDNARKTAQEKFNIHRFAKDWEKVFAKVANKRRVQKDSHYPGMNSGSLEL